jgi:hypothetical protein
VFWIEESGIISNSEAMKKKETGDPASRKESQKASNLAHNPEAKGRGLAEEDQQGRSQSAKPIFLVGISKKGIIINFWIFNILKNNFRGTLYKTQPDDNIFAIIHHTK